MKIINPLQTPIPQSAAIYNGVVLHEIDRMAIQNVIHSAASPYHNKWNALLVRIQKLFNEINRSDAYNNLLDVKIDRQFVSKDRQIYWTVSLEPAEWMRLAGEIQ